MTLLPIENTKNSKLQNLKEKAKLNPRSTSGFCQKYNKKSVSGTRSTTILKGHVGAANKWSDSLKLTTVKKHNFQTSHLC